MTLKKTIRFLDNATDAVLLIIFLFFFLIGGYALYDSYRVYTDSYDNSLLRFKPGYEQEYVDGRQILKKKMAGWLTIDDTKVDYPVMQGETNNEFLNTDPYGDYSLTGSIFMDSRNSRDPEALDDITLIYGHHMAEGAMFGALDAFEKVKYFDAHREGTFTLDKTAYRVRFFAYMISDATNDLIFNPTEVRQEDTMAYIRKDAAIFREEELKNRKDLKIIILSTCKFPDSTERTLLIGALEKK